jgi:phosphatidylinositol alpha-1,6-mannosyltransferase
VSEIFPPKTGGSGRWFWEVYRRLPRDTYVIAAGEHPRQAEFDRGHDLRVLRLPLALRSWGLASWAGLTGYANAIRKLSALVRAEEVGMLHCGRCLPEGMMALALKCWHGFPYACYVHGEELNVIAASRELRWLARRVLRAAAFVIANSRNTRAILTDEWQVPGDRVRLLYPGVDTDRFVPAPRNAAARAALRWGDRPVVLTVGRLQKRKGHDTMIRALTAVQKAVPDVLYAIAGDGEERQYLEGLAAQAGLTGHVQFLGEVNDDVLVRCYQQCDLFVLPNRRVGQDFEGFGMVLVEAQASGKPVVAGASGGTAETMRIPETGQAVSCEQPDGLARLVAEFLGNRARLTRMGEAARRWAVEQFDWSTLARQAEGIFSNAPASVRRFKAARDESPAAQDLAVSVGVADLGNTRSH